MNEILILNVILKSEMILAELDYKKKHNYNYDIFKMRKAIFQRKKIKEISKELFKLNLEKASKIYDIVPNKISELIDEDKIK